MPRLLIISLLVSLFGLATKSLAEEHQGEVAQDQRVEDKIDSLKKPMYTPFVELHVLEEIKQLRVDLADQRHDLMQQILDREHTSVDRAVTYATDTVTYFFYLIAGVTSILLLVGWNSLREIKERMHTLADEEVSKLVDEYEKRLSSIEKQLHQKSQHIQENREEIELTQDIQSLWLRAGQESNPTNKIGIYDEILELKPDDSEALTYKADAVLELNEPQWAINLCLEALKTDKENCHAFFQLGCAYTTLHQFDEAVHYLSKALALKESYRESIRNDKALVPMHDYPPYQALISAAEEEHNKESN